MFLTAVLTVLGVAAPTINPPLHLTGIAFNQSLEIEVRDLPPSVADDLGRKALERIKAIEKLTDPNGSAASGVALLNVAAGKPAIKLDPDLFALLLKAASFCEWSSGVHGPLGGRLAALWGLDDPVTAIPIPSDVEAARDSAACNRLELDERNSLVRLAAGSRIDLRGFAPGFAIDRAVDLLRAAGAANGWVRIGYVARAFGPGPAGGGWPFELPQVAGMTEHERVALLNRSIAVKRFDDKKLGAGGEKWSPYLDQRHGKPGGQGVLLAAASTLLAVDSEAMAVTMFAAGNREGQSMLGAAQPPPAVLWLLGMGNGPPLRAETRWSQVRRR